MTDDRTPRESPEERTVDGLLGLLRDGEPDRIERRVQSAFRAIESRRSGRQRRIRLRRSLTGALGAAAAIAILVLVIVGSETSGTSRLASLSFVPKALRTR